MSTQPVSNLTYPQLQSFYPSRPDNEPVGIPTRGSANEAFTVAINTTRSSHLAERESFWHQRRAALDQLGSALQSGDAAAAQKAYDALVALGQGGPLRNGQAFQRADRAQDFAALGQALQAGDLTAAQNAFNALTGSFRPGPSLLGPPTPAPTPGSENGGPVGPPTIAPPAPSPNGGPVGPPEIVINVGGASSANGGAGEIVVNIPQPSNTPEEVQISFGNDGSGQVKIEVNQKDGREEVALNLSGSHNYQLVLNLLQPESSPAAQRVSLQA